MHTRERLVLLLYTLFNAISNQFIHLYSDEGYYWLWSKKLDFSYFDHPPMVAYIIKLTTLFGDEPFFVRLGAVFMVSGSAYLLYLLAKKMFDEKTAIYTFYIYISSIIILGASTIIAPDIPLMFFTVLFLYSGYIYLYENNNRYAFLTGFAAGAMLLSKYTGILIIFAILLYILFYRRHLFKDKYFYFAIIIAIVLFSPVLYWNYIHDFISFKFQLNHGIAEEKVFNPKEFVKFAGAQFGLFHPLYLIPLLGFIYLDKERFQEKKVYLLLPFIFTLGFFLYHASFKHANAQWAGPAYLSATILLGYYLAKYNYTKLLFTALGLSGLMLVLLKTPLGDHFEPIQRIHAKLGQINNFESDLKALNLDIDSYDYILVDDYHGSEIPYYLKRHKNILVLNSARFSNFNIWRNQDLNISMQDPLSSIPSLGKSLYIGCSLENFEELKTLFHSSKFLMYSHKKVAHKNLDYYFVEFQN